MKSKILDNLNSLLYVFVGFVTLFLVSCAAVACSGSYGNVYFYDAFGLFGFASACISINLAYGGTYGTIYKSVGALPAAGVFNIFILICAVAVLAVGVFTLLKKTGVFDWKIDEKIGNFDLISKILFSVLTGFAFLSLLCVSIFAGANQGYSVGGGAVLIFVFAVLACATIWLLPLILKKVEIKKEANEAKATEAASETVVVKEKTAKTKSAKKPAETEIAVEGVVETADETADETKSDEN